MEPDGNPLLRDFAWLARVDRALEKIESGTYGFSAVSGDRISQECIDDAAGDLHLERTGVLAHWRAGTTPMKSVAGPEATFVSIAGPAAHSLRNEDVSRLISAAAATLDSDRASAKACLQRAVELLSATVEARRVQAAIRGGLAPWQKRNVNAYIAANIGSTIRVSDLAHIARLSLGHFFRAYRESFGEPPLAHIARLRIQRAQSLMLRPGASLSQIALDCGMHDQSHFTRVFRRIVGMNPGTWRRQFSATDANRGVEKKRVSLQGI